MCEKVHQLEDKTRTMSKQHHELENTCSENRKDVGELKAGQKAIISRLESMERTQAQRFQDLKDLIRQVAK